MEVGINDDVPSSTSGYVCEQEQIASYCPVGWTYYNDVLGYEGHDSCLKMSTTTLSNWTTGMLTCPPGSHALTIKGSSTSYGLLPFAMALAAQSNNVIFFGCSQSSTATTRAAGWSWLDGTPASNLNCGNGLGGGGCGIWGANQPE